MCKRRTPPKMSAGKYDESGGNAAVRLDGTACRVCLHAKGTEALFDGFGTVEQYRYCTMLAAAEDDGLPGKLCLQCKSHLHIAYDFRFQAIYAERFFRRTSLLPATDVPKERATGAGDEQKGLEENMQEIDALLATAPIELSLPDEIAAKEVFVCVVGEDAVRQRQRQRQEPTDEMSDRLGHYSDSDGLSDHFAAVFANDDPIRKIGEKRKEASGRLVAASSSEQDTSFDVVAFAPSSTIGALCRDSKIECNICGTTFTHINSLKQHLMKHSGERPFRCEYCAKTFSRRTVLNIHRRLHTGEKPYSCDECIQTFITKEAMHRHREREHQQLLDGAERRHDSEELSCPICHQTYPSEKALQVHTKKTHLRGTARKRTKSTAKRHEHGQQLVEKPRRPLLMVDRAGKPLATVKYCKTCQRGFPSKWELVAHQETHTDAEMLQCDACSQSFARLYELLCHVQAAHSPTAESAACKYIAVPPTNTNTTPTTVKRVSLDEEDYDKPLAELIKAKSAQQKRSANRKGATQRQDDHCGANATSDGRQCSATMYPTNSIARRVRMRLHSTEQPSYSCELCGKAFRRHNVLVVHRRRHQDATPMRCCLCAEEFPTRFALKQHVTKEHMERTSSQRRDSGDAELRQCQLCDHAPMPLRDVAEHTFHTHYPAEVFECSECAAKFENSTKFRFHLERHKTGTHTQPHTITHNHTQSHTTTPTQLGR